MNLFKAVAKRYSLLSFVMYKLSCVLSLFAVGAKLESARAEKQCNQEYQAARIYVETEALEFSTAAAKEQDD